MSTHADESLLCSSAVKKTSYFLTKECIVVDYLNQPDLSCYSHMYTVCRSVTDVF